MVTDGPANTFDKDIETVGRIYQFLIPLAVGESSQKKSAELI